MRFRTLCVLFMVLSATFACTDNDDDDSADDETNDDDASASDDDSDDDASSDDDVSSDDDATPIVYGDDLVYADDRLYVRLNDGAKGFAEEFALGDLYGYYDVAVADFDGNAIPDIAAIRPNVIDVYLNQGNGRDYELVSTTTGFVPRIAVAGDFNNDGNMDLFGGAASSDDLYFYSGDGAGGFKAQLIEEHDGIIYSLTTADFDGDGLPDLAAGTRKYLYFYLNQGDGVFTKSQTFNGYWASGFFVSLIAADWNEDGIVDMVADNDYGEIHFLSGNGDGTFDESKKLEVGTGNYFIAYEDFNRDGKSDLIYSDYNAFRAQLNLMLGKGGGKFFDAKLIYECEQIDSLAVGLFNDDPYLDLALGFEDWNQKGPSPYPHLGIMTWHGASGFSDPTVLGKVNYIVRIADLDGI